MADVRLVPVVQMSGRGGLPLRKRFCAGAGVAPTEEEKEDAIEERAAQSTLAAKSLGAEAAIRGRCASIEEPLQQLRRASGACLMSRRRSAV